MSVAVEGFCKLLLNGALADCKTFSTLALLFFNPITAENVYLRQTCALFFALYIPFGDRLEGGESRRDLVYSALLTCVKSVLNAPAESPLRDVQLQTFAGFFLSVLSNPATQK